MDFVAVRDFRIRPGTVWKRLKKSGNLLVTSNGKPIAMLRDIEGHDIAEEIKLEALSKGLNAVSRMREHAIREGINALSEKDIGKEIKAVRKHRHARCH